MPSQIELTDGRDLNSLLTEKPNATESPALAYSIDASDNSQKSFTQRMKNKLAGLFSNDTPGKRLDKRIADTLSKLTKYRIVFGYTNSDDVIIDDMRKVIQSRNAYDWENILPKIGGQIARELDLSATPEMSNYVADWLLTGALNNTSEQSKQFAKAMRDNPAKAELMQAVRDTFQEIADMTPTERAKSKIVRTDQSFWKRLKSDGGFIEEFLDDLNPVKKAIDRAKKEATPEIAELIEQTNVYKSLRRLRGGSASTPCGCGTAPFPRILR